MKTYAPVQTDAEAILDKLNSYRRSVPEMDEYARKFAKWVDITSEWTNSTISLYTFHDNSKLEIVTNTTLRTL